MAIVMCVSAAAGFMLVPEAWRMSVLAAAGAQPTVAQLEMARATLDG